MHHQRKDGHTVIELMIGLAITVIVILAGVWGFSKWSKVQIYENERSDLVRKSKQISGLLNRLIGAAVRVSGQSTRQVGFDALTVLNKEGQPFIPESVAQLDKIGGLKFFTEYQGRYSRLVASISRSDPKLECLDWVTLESIDGAGVRHNYPLRNAFRWVASSLYDREFLILSNTRTVNIVQRGADLSPKTYVDGTTDQAFRFDVDHESSVCLRDIDFAEGSTQLIHVTPWRLYLDSNSQELILEDEISKERRILSDNIENLGIQLTFAPRQKVGSKDKIVPDRGLRHWVEYRTSYGCTSGICCDDSDKEKAKLCVGAEDIDKVSFEIQLSSSYKPDPESMQGADQAGFSLNSAGELSYAEPAGIQIAFARYQLISSIDDELNEGLFSNCSLSDHCKAECSSLFVSEDPGSPRYRLYGELYGAYCQCGTDDKGNFTSPLTDEGFEKIPTALTYDDEAALADEQKAQALACVSFFGPSNPNRDLRTKLGFAKFLSSYGLQPSNHFYNPAGPAGYYLKTADTTPDDYWGRWRKLANAIVAELSEDTDYKLDDEHAKHIACGSFREFDILWNSYAATVGTSKFTPMSPGARQCQCQLYLTDSDGTVTDLPMPPWAIDFSAVCDSARCPNLYESGKMKVKSPGVQGFNKNFASVCACASQPALNPETGAPTADLISKPYSDNGNGVTDGDEGKYGLINFRNRLGSEATLTDPKYYWNLALGGLGSPDCSLSSPGDCKVDRCDLLICNTLQIRGQNCCSQGPTTDPDRYTDRDRYIASMISDPAKKDYARYCNTTLCHRGYGSPEDLILYREWITGTDRGKELPDWCQDLGGSVDHDGGAEAH